jgi:signal transduction histidine kinase
MGRTRVLDRMLERAEAPSGLPLWISVTVRAAAAVIVLGAVAIEGGRLPLLVQLGLAVAALAPWVPWTLTTRSPAYLLLTFGPVLVLTYTGATPVCFALLALATARYAVNAPIAASTLFAVAAVVCVYGRELVVEHTNWLVWMWYVQVGLALGWVLRGQRLLVLRTEEAAHERARLAAFEERRRIARDIHDTLAHSLTVMMVHINSARLHLRDEPDSVGEALDELASLGRASLEDVRRSVGLLSGTTACDEPVDPTSAAHAVEELVNSFRRAGVDIVLRLDVGMEQMGLLADAPTTLWSTAHRVIQESLANAVRHAPGSSIEISVEIDDVWLRIEIANALAERVVALDVPSGGNGIRGMRERTAMVGGTFRAVAEGTRWVVRADLPLRRRPARSGEARGSHALGKVS